MSFLDKGRTSTSTTRTASVPQATTNIFMRHPNLFIAIVAAAVALAVGASVLAGIMASESVKLRGRLSAGTVPVVLASRDLVLGETLDEAALITADVPKPFVGGDALSDVSQAIGRKLTVSAGVNSQISAQMLSGEGNVSSLAFAVNPKMVATSVAVSSETGLAGLLHPQDTVDLLIRGEALTEGARVLALDSSLTGNVNGYSTVTLELTPEVACALQAAQDGGGHIRLTLHSASENKAGE